MARHTRVNVGFIATESTYGTPPSFVASDAVLFVGAPPKPEFIVQGASRDLMWPYFGASDELQGMRPAKISFSVELAGSGTAGTAPAWGKLLLACVMAQAISAGSRVEYTPITNAPQSVAMDWFLDGVRYTMRGMMGTAKLNLQGNERPTLDFELTGYGTTAQTGSPTTPDFSAYRRPEFITNDNGSIFKLGGSYATGSITGGTALIMRGLSLDLGNDINHMQLIGGEGIDMAGRSVTGSGMVELTAANEVQWRTDQYAATLTSLSFEHGSTAGNKVVIFMPNIQRRNQQVVDYQGRPMISFDLTAVPLTGNDEIRIVLK